MNIPSYDEQIMHIPSYDEQMKMLRNIADMATEAYERPMDAWFSNMVTTYVRDPLTFTGVFVGLQPCLLRDCGGDKVWGKWCVNFPEALEAAAVHCHEVSEELRKLKDQNL